MKISFNNRLEAIDWIAQNVRDEQTFETLREQLNYNYIYESEYFVNFEEDNPNIILEDELLDN